MRKIIFQILFVVFTTAVGKGVLLFLGTFQIYPEKWIATLLSVAFSPIYIGAISWLLAGVFGSICLVAWEVFDITKKLKSFFSNFVSTVSTSNQADEQPLFDLERTDRALLKGNTVEGGQIAKIKNSAGVIMQNNKRKK